MSVTYNITGLAPGLLDSDRVRVGISADGDGYVLNLTKGPAFSDWLGSGVRTTAGTVGELNRAGMHRLLDAWLDGVEFE